MWFVDVFFTIVGYVQHGNYIFLEIHNVGLWYGEVAKNCKFLLIPCRCKIEQPETRGCNGIKNLKWKCACGSSFVMIIWKQLFLKIIELNHQAVLSAEIIREQRDTDAENLLWWYFLLLTFFQFSLSLVASALYMLNCPIMYSLSERESGSKHVRNCAYLSKTENSYYYQELDL